MILDHLNLGDIKLETRRITQALGVVGNLISVSQVDPSKSIEMSAAMLGIEVKKEPTSMDSVEEFITARTSEEYQRNLAKVMKDIEN